MKEKIDIHGLPPGWESRTTYGKHILCHVTFQLYFFYLSQNKLDRVTHLKSKSYKAEKDASILFYGTGQAKRFFFEKSK